MDDDDDDDDDGGGGGGDADADADADADDDDDDDVFGIWIEMGWFQVVDGSGGSGYVKFWCTDILHTSSTNPWVHSKITIASDGMVWVRPKMGDWKFS